jgi:phosphate transport system protein
MTEKFDAELERLQGEVHDMSMLARGMFCDAFSALISRDTALADRVLDKRQEIRDRLYRTEDHAYQILTLYQPVARDLRTVVACLKVAAALERIGRYGNDMARIVGYLAAVGAFKDERHLSNLLSIPQMAKMAGEMIDTAITAFETGNLSLVEDFGARDDAVDALGYTSFRECVSYMLEDPSTITRAANYVMVARYLERSADHACTIAEATIFMQTGERVEIK